MDVLNGWTIGQVSPAAAGALGVMLSVIGSVLYLRDVRHRRTTPHRGSWLVWGVIAVVAATSNGSDGGRWSLVVLWAQALSTLAVLLVAVRCGVGWFTRTNLLMLSVAALGIIGWTTLADPTAASACAAAADAAGLLAITPKIWLDPSSETLATYALAGATGMLAALAVQAWNPGLLLYPVYFCLGNAATATLIATRRRMLQHAAAVRLFSPGRFTCSNTLPSHAQPNSLMAGGNPPEIKGWASSPWRVGRGTEGGGRNATLEGSVGDGGNG